ncbi:MAG: TonB-dependent receptor [Akkermansiaceae bacterium]|jgi:iron complex outermembrane receptor protein|nr:TonB-dependent receptor [Akkermansiaceae bacterium]
MRTRFILLLFAAGPLVAREDGIRLDPLVVTGRRAGGDSPLETLTPLPPPAGPRLTETLAFVPGLVVQDSFGGFDPPRIMVRGSGIQSAPTSRGIAMSWFGLPLNAADGSFNLTLIENEWLESAALSRGTAAGVPALGGALDFDPDVFRPVSSMAALAAGDDTFSLHARGTGTHDSHSLAARAAWFRTDGWRDHSRQERESVFAASRFILDGESDLTISFLGSTPWYEVPGPLTKSQAFDDPASVSPIVRRDRPRRDTRHAHLNASLTRRIDDTRYLASAGVTATDDTFYQLLPNGVSTTDAWDSYVRLLAEHEWGGDTQLTTFSALLQTGWWDAVRHRNNSGNKGVKIGDMRLRPLTFTAALDHRIEIDDRQRIELGLSWLAARRTIDDRLYFEGTAQDLDHSDHFLAPRLAWSYDITETIAFTASASRSYEPPTYGDLLFTAGPPAARVLRVTDLDWQRADTLEIGCQGNHGRFSWSAFLHHSWWDGELLRLADENGAPRGTVNAGDTIHRGFEAGFAWDMFQHGEISSALAVSYTYNDARFDHDKVLGDNRLGGVPPHVATISLPLTHADGWFATPGCQLRSGSTYADHANDLSYGGTTLFSLELGRRQTDGWSVIFGIQNLFDRDAIASTAGVLDRAVNPATTSIFLPANGRTFSLRLEHAW